jgi:hypothetical protein
MKAGTGFHECRITDYFGNVVTIMRGAFVILPTIGGQ